MKIASIIGVCPQFMLKYLKLLGILNLKYNQAKKKMTTLTIIGLGYVGLPLAIAFKSVGFDVFGYDTNEERVKDVGEGKYPFSVDTSFDPLHYNKHFSSI